MTTTMSWSMKEKKIKLPVSKHVDTLILLMFACHCVIILKLPLLGFVDQVVLVMENQDADPSSLVVVLPFGPKVRCLVQCPMIL